ncbi:hypothetical protein F4859DRAFT_500702 [Xylaria cf. heliscus]|nr:hypothetical protein F4859DRAFT_500702 [Xylaria cf. heliscus]
MGSQGQPSSMRAMNHAFQIWEVALNIGRSESAVRRSLQENDELASLLSPVKTGRWSPADEDMLRESLAKRSVPNKKRIAKSIGRKVESVAGKIIKLAKTPDSPMPHLSATIPPDEKLSQSERAILEGRLDCILEGLTRAGKAAQWHHVLMGTSRTEWIEQILALIPTPVGRILAAPSPPTISTLRTLEWEDTTKMGVYAWILTRKVRNPFYPEHHIYIGSATKYGWGTGRFATLLSMEVKSSEPNEVAMARQLMVLAEATLTIWLGALYVGRLDYQLQCLPLRSLCPWGLEQISYCGLCSHNPLSLDITYPEGYVQP